MKVSWNITVAKDRQNKSESGAMQLHHREEHFPTSSLFMCWGMSRHDTIGFITADDFLPSREQPSAAGNKTRESLSHNPLPFMHDFAFIHSFTHASISTFLDLSLFIFDGSFSFALALALSAVAASWYERE